MHPKLLRPPDTIVVALKGSIVIRIALNPPIVKFNLLFIWQNVRATLQLAELGIYVKLSQRDRGIVPQTATWPTKVEIGTHHEPQLSEITAPNVYMMHIW